MDNSESTRNPCSYIESLARWAAVLTGKGQGLSSKAVLLIYNHTATSAVTDKNAIMFGSIII